MANLKIKKKSVHVVIPDGYSFSQIIEMPRLKEKELLSAIKYQADQFIPMSLEETSLDLEILEDDKINKKLLVLIVASSQKLISRITSVVETAGLIPETIENELSACGRFFSSQLKPQNKEGGIILVNIGYATSSLYFFDIKKSLITATHNFKIGYELFVKETQINTSFDLQKTKDVLKRIGIAKDASIDLETVLKPATEDLLKETEKFVFQIKEKYHLPKIDQIYAFNLANSVNQLTKKIEDRFATPTSLLPLTSFLGQNKNLPAASGDLSSFVCSVGTCLE